MKKFAIAALLLVAGALVFMKIFGGGGVQDFEESFEWLRNPNQVYTGDGETGTAAEQTKNE